MTQSVSFEFLVLSVELRKGNENPKSVFAYGYAETSPKQIQRTKNNKFKTTGNRGVIGKS
jgi:hypothetical protein